MSKSNMNTREKILDKALEMFNERGIEYVGLRELASLLNIRVSNISYYFPTKDDLVYALSLQLSKKNALAFEQKENETMQSFLDMFCQVFKNHYEFRCLMLSVVRVIKQNKHMAATYQKTQHLRNATLHANLQTLEQAGYLKLKDETDRKFLVSGISLISRFWISEAAVSFRNLNTEELIQHYLFLITKLLMPYATSMGKREIHVFLENLHDPGYNMGQEEAQIAKK